ncbi:MAG: hypothetical protein MK108_14220 [Mariniblastus sp.]|nr:hypothetical protein [Mariniblastus sp.]
MSPNVLHRYRHLIWLVVAFLVTWSGLFALSSAYPLDVYGGEPIAMAVVLLVSMLGLTMGFLQLACLWLVFGPGSYPYRILWSVLACLAGMGGMLVTMILEGWNDPNGHRFLVELVMGVLLLFPFFFLVLQLPNAMVRFLFGWRLEWGDAPPPERRLAISDLLTITALIAAAAASRSWVKFDVRDGVNLEAVMGVGLFWVPAWILFTLPMLYFLLTPWTKKSDLPGWKGVGLAMYVALLLVSGFILGTWMGGVEVVYILCLVLVLVLSLLISLDVSRRSGFRLWTRGSRRAYERAHGTGRQEAEPPVSPVDPLELDPPG